MSLQKKTDGHSGAEKEKRKSSHRGTDERVFVVICRTFLRYRLLTAASAAAVTGAVIVSLLPPLVLGGIIDTLTDFQMVPFSRILLYFGLTALTGLLDSGRECLLTILGQKITHMLRSALSQKMNRLTASQLSRQEPGAVVSRFVGDVDTVENLFSSGIVSMFADGCRIIGILAIIFLKNTGLALVLCLVLPVIFFFTRHVQRNMLRAHTENRAAVARVTGHVPETIRCIRMIHTLNREEYMKDSYDRYIGQSYDAIEKTNFYDAIYSPVILITNALVVAAVMLLSASGNAGILSLFGMSVGTSVAVISYIAQIFGPIESLGMEIQTIQSAVAGVNRINEYLHLPERDPGQMQTREAQNSLKSSGNADHTETLEALEALKNADHTEALKNADYTEALEALEILEKSEGSSRVFCAELKDVTFGYNERNVLEHFSMQIREGEHVTLAGRTGAGKSTIFRLLLGLYQPLKGQVLINGRDALTVKDCEKRKIFGYVEQNFHMVPGTVLDQITLRDGDITPQMAERAACLAGLHETICSLEKGYETLCTPSIFSQGQWQLLSIARAVAADPQILLLDEITANLDADTEKHVMEAVSNVSASRTVISISHRFFRKTGGRIIVIGETS